MTSIAVAKDFEALSEITAIVKNVFPNDLIEAFADPLWAIKYSYYNKIDVAFISTEIHQRIGLNALKLGETFRSRCPNIKIVFFATPSQNAHKQNAYALFDEEKASGRSAFVHMPVTEEDIKNVCLAK